MAAQLCAALDTVVLNFVHCRHDRRVMAPVAERLVEYVRGIFGGRARCRHTAMADVPDGYEGCPGSFAIIWEASRWESSRVICTTHGSKPPSEGQLLRALLAQLFATAAMEPVEPLSTAAQSWADVIEANTERERLTQAEAAAAARAAAAAAAQALPAARGLASASGPRPHPRPASMPKISRAGSAPVQPQPRPQPQPTQPPPQPLPGPPQPQPLLRPRPRPQPSSRAATAAPRRSVPPSARRRKDGGSAAIVPPPLGFVDGLPVFERPAVLRPSSSFAGAKPLETDRRWHGPIVNPSPMGTHPSSRPGSPGARPGSARPPPGLALLMQQYELTY